MKEECLICGAPLEYLETDVQMQCEICRKKELAKTRCVNGHYVCSDCHMQGLDSIVELCLRETACDPIAIVERMMALPSCHMHGPEHHVMVGAALLTAYHNAGGDIDLSDALMEMLRRGKSVPGGACGFWGACGAGISTGMFVSIISRSTPLTDEPFALSHKMTAAALGQIGEIGGPRCCKRDSFLSILTAIDFVKEHFGIALQKQEVVCRYAAQNNQCNGKRCPSARRTGLRNDMAAGVETPVCRPAGSAQNRDLARSFDSMKKRFLKIVIGIVFVCILFVGFLYANNDIGMTSTNLETDIRSSQKIKDDWTLDGSVSNTMAAYISYSQDMSDHTFSVYVNRPGLSFGYFFRGGGTLSGIQRGIVEFTVEGYNERAFISMNQQQVQQLEIDDGNTIQVVDIDSNKPFAIVLPINAGNITFYDVNRNTVEYWNNPL